MFRLPIVLALVALQYAIAGPSISTAEDEILFRKVRVFDGVKVIPETEVLVAGGKIQQIGDRLDTPDGATIVDGSGKGSVAAGRAVYKYIDQGLVDGIVNGSGVASDEAGQGLRKLQSGKVQQYAAIMFAAVAILAGILVIVVQ